MLGGEISKHNIPSIIDIGISSTLNVSGGMINTGEFVLYGSSYTLISGGDITANHLKVYYDAIVDIRGGELRLNSFDMVVSNELPTINVYGHDFTYAGEIISGYLIDNSPFSIGGVSESEYSRFNLIPEPATLLLFGLGTLLLRKSH
jgi:hypothetical protein